MAGSQSNTLNDEEIQPSVAQLSVSRSDVGVMNNCVKCTKLRYVRCVDCVRSAKASCDIESKQISLNKKWPESSVMKQNSGGEHIYEGGRGATSKIKIKKGVRRLSSSLCSKAENKNPHILENTTFAGKMGPEEKINTPIKRILFEHRPVHNLVAKFESYCELPGFVSPVGCSESPAKRRKLLPGVSQPNHPVD